MQKNDFASLCTCLLKCEISPNIIQVSAEGRDGNRDAYLDGNYNLIRNYEWIKGLSIFQFKHYTTELTKSRSQAFRDFSTEFDETIEMYPSMKNYGFITNVPHSGLPIDGSFDKINRKIKEIKERFLLNVFYWDGNEICNLIDINIKSVGHFFNKMEKVHQFSNTLNPNFFSENLDEFKWQLERIINSNDDFLSPSSRGISSWYYCGQYFRVISLCGNVFKLYSKHEEWNKDDELKKYIIKLIIIYSLSLLKIGNLTQSSLLIKNLQITFGLTVNEKAWVYNALAIISGKLDNEINQEYYSNLAITYANESNTQWLSKEIKLRDIHKKDWKANENNKVINDEDFLESVNLVLNCKSNNIGVENYLSALKSEYIALHFGWDEKRIEDAQIRAENALKYFNNENNKSEIARLKSEQGRILLKFPEKSIESIEYLKDGIKERAQIYDLARLRYDLSWLAEAYINIDNKILSAYLLISSFILHFKLYNNTNVDKGLYNRNLCLLKKVEKRIGENWNEYILKKQHYYLIMEELLGIDAFEISQIITPVLLDQTKSKIEKLFL